eukprot:TRINITY_DN2918_c0_g2_i4.p1 TRINITY_DN2918_c0_g2~~TRINITY_DN2918_c0_g2_i4.p1  ORF type:complete len:400 (-),score=62.49 TRINITY_DN2918_c0_g2_i4:911-2110(-)
MRSRDGETDTAKPKKRFGHTMCCTVVGGFENAAYVFGGCLATGKASNELWKLDLDSEKWTPLLSTDGDPPQPRFSHASVLVGRRLYVYGGCDDYNNYFDDLHVYDIDDRSWEQLSTGGARPSARHGHSLSCVANRIYLFGGMSQHSTFGDLFCFNIDTVEWEKVEMEGIAPNSRAFHSTIAIQKNIYLYGGRSSNGDAYGDLWVLRAEDQDAERWEYLQPTGALPTPRFSHALAAYGDSFLLYGGFTKDSDILQDIYAFDTKGATWQVITVKILLPRCYSHTFVTYNGALLIYGGRDRYGPLRMDLMSVKIGSDSSHAAPVPSLLPKMTLGNPERATGTLVVRKAAQTEEHGIIVGATRRLVGWRSFSLLQFAFGVALGYYLGIRFLHGCFFFLATIIL